MAKQFVYKFSKDDLEVHNHTEVLLDIIRKNNSKVIAEIGVDKAINARHILRHCSDIIQEYWGIDVWEVDYPNKYLGVCKYFPFFPQFRILRIDSENATKIFQTWYRYRNTYEYFDLVFLDADHTYEGVKKDIELWYPLIKKNGILSGHDYGFNNTGTYKGVQKAVDEVFGKDNDNVLVHCDSGLWYIRKQS
jgi:hypothetical protein